VPLDEQLERSARTNRDIEDRVLEKVRRENRIRVQERIKDVYVATVSIATGGSYTGANGSGSLSIGQKLKNKTTIIVSAGGLVKLDFKDGAVLLIGENSTVLFDAGKVELIAGGGTSYMQYISGSTNVLVTVPGGIITLNGTDIDVVNNDTTKITTVRSRDGGIDVNASPATSSILATNAPDRVIVMNYSGLPVSVNNLPSANPSYISHDNSIYNKISVPSNTVPVDVSKANAYIIKDPEVLTPSLILGQELLIKLTYSKSVVVNTSPSPKVGLILKNDSNIRTASYKSGSGTNELIFGYATATGDDGMSVAVNILASNDLNGLSDDTSIISTDTNTKAISTYNAPTVPNIYITGTPVISSINGIATPTCSPTANICNMGDTLTFVATYSKPLNPSIGSPYLALNIGGVAKQANGVFTSPDKITFSYPIASGDIDEVGGITINGAVQNSGSIIDDTNGFVADNAIPGILTNTIEVDTSNPTITSTIPANGATEISPLANITITFDDLIATGTAGNIRIVNDTDSITTTIAYNDVSQLSISGNTLTINPTTNLATNKDYHVEIDNTVLRDNAGNIEPVSFPNFTFTTTSKPFITGIVQSPTSGTLGIGGTVTYTATFNEAVNITNTPRLQIAIDSGGPVYADYSSGTGTNSITFTYTVASGQTDNSSGIILTTGTSALDFNGGDIRNLTNNQALQNVPSPSPANSVKIDTTAPTISSIAVTGGNYRLGVTINITVQLADTNTIAVSTPPTSINVVVRDNLGVDQTNTANYISYNAGAKTMLFRYTVTSSDLDTLALGSGIVVPANALNMGAGVIQDAGGNNLVTTYAPTTTSTAYADGITPTLTSSTPADGATGISTSANIVLNYSENMAIGTGTINIRRGSDDSVFEAITLPNSKVTVSTNQITINPAGTFAATTDYYLDLPAGAVRDTFANNASAITKTSSPKVLFTTDNTTSISGVSFNAPTVTNGVYGDGYNIDITATFTNPVNITGNPRIPITLTSGIVYADYLSGTGTSNIIFRYTTGTLHSNLSGGIGIASNINLPTGFDTIKDFVTNDALLSLPALANTIRIDNTAPVLSSTTLATAAGTYGDTALIGVNLNFSEPVTIVTGTPTIDLLIGATTRTATYISGSGTSTLRFNYTVQAGDNDANGIDVKLNTIAGTITDVVNGGNATAFALANPLTYFASRRVDTTAPIINSITIPPGAYSTGNNITPINITFNEPVTIVSGTPTLGINIDSGTITATGCSLISTTVLRCSYTVQVGNLETTSPITFPASPITGTFNITDGVTIGTVNPLTNSYGGTAPGVTMNLGSWTGFTSPATPEINVNAYSVAVGDFNGDGKLDFVTSGGASNRVSVRLGNGSGGFTSPTPPQVTLPNSSGPVSVAVGDFNGDSNQDFVTANILSDKVSIRLGNGSGGFTSPATPEITLPAGSSPYSVAVGDFNGDGNQDFVTANFDSSKVSIRLGNGNGGFTSPATPEITLPAGSSPYSVAVGDFNSDSKLDFVTANINSSKVSIRLGNGSGGFTSPAIPQITLPAGSSPVSVAVGDFNGDGKPDFVTANVINPNTVSIRLGN